MEAASDQPRCQSIPGSLGKRGARFRHPWPRYFQIDHGLAAMVVYEFEPVPGAACRQPDQRGRAGESSRLHRRNYGLAVSGTQLAPVGHGTLGLASARIGEEPIRALDLRFEGTGNQVHAHLKVDLPAARSADATVQYEPKQQAYQVELHASGIKLDQLETVKARTLQVPGVLNVNANGRGTVQDPKMQAVIEVPQLQIRDQVISGLKLETTVANHIANFNLDSHILQTHAGGHGTIQLKGDYVADVNLDTQAIPLDPLFALYAPSQAGNLSGQTELHASLRGPLKDKTRLEAHLLVPQLALNYKNTIQLAAAAPVRVDYTNGVLNLQRSTIRGTGTEITFQASVPTAKDASASMLMRGNIDLRLAQLLTPDITSGRGT